MCTYIAISSASSRTTYPDSYLEYWADIYRQQAVSAHNITLEQFLARPEAILRRLDKLDSVLEELIELRDLLGTQEVRHAVM